MPVARRIACVRERERERQRARERERVCVRVINNCAQLSVCIRWQASTVSREILLTMGPFVPP